MLLLLLVDRRDDSGWMIWMMDVIADDILYGRTPGANRTTTRERGSGIVFVEQRTGDRDECCRVAVERASRTPNNVGGRGRFWRLVGSARSIFLLRPAAIAGVSKAVCRGSSLRASPARSAGVREGRSIMLAMSFAAVRWVDFCCRDDNIILIGEQWPILGAAAAMVLL